MSSPAAASQYGAVVSKLGEKAHQFAVGGAVTKGGVANIITTYVDKQGGNGEDVLNAMYELLQTKNALLLKEANSVLVIEKLRPKIVALHFFTTDEGSTLMAALSVLIEKIKASDIDQAYGENESVELVNGLKQKGINLFKSDVAEFDWRAAV